MYRPVMPLVLKRSPGDRRPMTLNIFSARVNAVAVAECQGAAKKVKNGIIVYNAIIVNKQRRRPC